jgi:DnaJ-class molecular chaperone
MTNLYETLGVSQSASFEEIERKYREMSRFFDPKKQAESDPTMKLYFDDLTLAYKTLSSE